MAVHHSVDWCDKEIPESLRFIYKHSDIEKLFVYIIIVMKYLKSWKFSGKKIETSYRYIRLYRQVYKNRQPKKIATKIAKTEEEAVWFWNNGWELQDKEGNKRYFRKAKVC